MFRTVKTALICKIWGSHSSSYEVFYLLTYVTICKHQFFINTCSQMYSMNSYKITNIAVQKIKINNRTKLLVRVTWWSQLILIDSYARWAMGRCLRTGRIQVTQTIWIYSRLANLRRWVMCNKTEKVRRLYMGRSTSLARNRFIWRLWKWI